MEHEMFRINESINRELALVNNLIKTAVFLLTSKIVNTEVNLLIDVVALFLPLLQTVSLSVDGYFENQEVIESVESEITPVPSTEEESCGIICKILANVKEPKLSSLSSSESKSIEQLLSVSETSSSQNPTDEHEKEFAKLNELMKFKDFDLVSGENVVVHSWLEVCDDPALLGLQDKYSYSSTVCEDLISHAIPQIDYSKVFSGEHNYTPDYYMMPFTYSITESEEVNLEDEILVSPQDEIRRSVEEVIENVLRLITEYESPEVKDKESYFMPEYPTFPEAGLILTLPVLIKMELNDPDLFPYTDFYQEIVHQEKTTIVFKPTRMKPEASRDIGAFCDFTMCPVNDFIVVNIDIVLKMLQAFNDIKVSTYELENQLGSLKGKVTTSKRLLQKKQELILEQQELENTMKLKFGRIIDINDLQDALESPHFHIRKQEIKVKMDSLRKELKNMKTLEASALKSLDELSYEDTRICYKLLELRKDFKFLNKSYSSKHPVLPKIGASKIMEFPEDSEI